MKVVEYKRFWLTQITPRSQIAPPHSGTLPLAASFLPLRFKSKKKRLFSPSNKFNNKQSKTRSATA